MRAEHRGSRRHHHHHGEEKIGRLLGHGELRYVILSLLKEKPRHGYELIKALEDLSSGAYSPSPGSIYPTLTYLEEGGFATSVLVENKKQFTITKEGALSLKENEEFVSELLRRFAKASERMSRLKHWVGKDDAQEIGRDDKSPIRKSMHRLKAELYSFMDAKKEIKQKVAEIIENAAEQLRKLK